MERNNSEISVYIDLIMDYYNISNPIKIAELIEEEFDIFISIHQISDYLDINKKEDYEKESLKMYNQYY